MFSFFLLKMIIRKAKYHSESYNLHIFGANLFNLTRSVSTLLSILRWQDAGKLITKQESNQVSDNYVWVRRRV